MELTISVDQAFNKANKFLKKGDVKNAFDIYQMVLKKFPKNIRAIDAIRKITDRPIVIRPHPRNHVEVDISKYKNVKMVGPRRDKNTYDDTDLTERLKSAWAVVSYSSNPAMTAAMHGIPVYVSEASLSFDVGNTTFENINNPSMPDRQRWANQLAFTEWWPDEIESGLPWKLIKKRLEEKYYNGPDL